MGWGGGARPVFEKGRLIPILIVFLSLSIQGTLAYLFFPFLSHPVHIGPAAVDRVGI